MGVKDKYKSALLTFIDETTGFECLVMNHPWRKNMFNYVIRNADSKDILHTDYWTLYPTENIEDIKVYCSKTANQLDELKESKKNEIKKMNELLDERIKDLKVLDERIKGVKENKE